MTVGVKEKWIKFYNTALLSYRNLTLVSAWEEFKHFEVQSQQWTWSLAKNRVGSFTQINKNTSLNWEKKLFYQLKSALWLVSDTD